MGLNRAKAQGYGSQNVLEKATVYLNEAERTLGKHCVLVSVCICIYVCDTVTNVSQFLVISHSSISAVPTMDTAYDILNITGTL